jgi:hypothetical protein
MEETDMKLQPIPEEEVLEVMNKGKKPKSIYKKNGQRKKTAPKTASEDQPEGKEKHILTPKRKAALERARAKLYEKRKAKAEQKVEKQVAPKVEVEQVKAPHSTMAHSLETSAPLQSAHHTMVHTMKSRAWD